MCRFQVVHGALPTGRGCQSHTPLLLPQPVEQFHRTGFHRHTVCEQLVHDLVIPLVKRKVIQIWIFPLEKRLGIGTVQPAALRNGIVYLCKAHFFSRLPPSLIADTLRVKNYAVHIKNNCFHAVPPVGKNSDTFIITESTSFCQYEKAAGA